MNKVIGLRVKGGALSVSGRVIHGDGFGKVLGFPTANIDRREYVRKGIKIKLGIWAGVVHYKLSVTNYKLYKAAIVLGPVDGKGLPKIEAHLINFTGNLYGKKLVLEFKEYIRPFKKFKDIQTLKNHIRQDVERIKKLVII